MTILREAQALFTHCPKQNDMTLNVNDLITVKQLADLWQVSRQTIYNRLEMGTAPAHERIGGRFYFSRTDAERLKPKPQDRH